ncbi:transmembrane protein with metallophosphoesterase domain [Apteryx mantelli]|uniref:Transmembrane protein with metallophosphoesterase domain n=1 Tax=Apteryx mantelli TaxID=2696672 RepID=A0ABM4E3Z0_9AVES|nr:PREDICTED: transmembrane protein with metallophosphoesterase domain [Apteryx mantelli mantelli]XP_025946076.1 transmembrane protein with metallophosphoesterase domain [Apteryx rowi]XP_025946077.1 transmembrane protein with metallophosphoesterase domain [Apteryx rowi]XP_025946078.1 transmembrane protein with metallophosphoesterase domain [Apteryx rowi]
MISFKQLPLEVKAAVAAGVVFFSMVLSRSYLAEQLELKTRRWLLRLQMALFANALMLIGSRHVWRSTVTMFSRSSVASSFCFMPWKVAVLMFLALAHSSFFTLLFLVAEEPYFFSLAAYTCLGAYIILIFFLFTLGSVEQAYKFLAGRGAKAGSGNKNSRTAMKPVLAVMLTVVLTVVGLLNASRPPTVNSVEVPVHKLPSTMNNLKVVLLSDIHLGPTVGKTKLAMIVRMVKALKPDITVIVGDLTDSEVDIIRPAVEPLGELNSPLGTYFVTGNHEYYTSDVGNWFELLKSFNIRPLHNENVKIVSPKNTDDWLCLAGVDDIEADVLRYSGHGMDLKKALSDCSSEHAIVLLAHQPIAAKWALQERPDINLILSGHTHGGQMFPLNAGAYFLNPFFVGLYKVGQNTFVYVSPGTMYFGIPMRLGSRAEITEIILHSP